MRRSKKGQTLIIIICLMLIALTIGVTVSTRYFSGLRTLTRGDDMSKAKAIAEAAIEKMLIVPDSTMQNYINFNNCGNACTTQVTEANGHVIKAAVTLQYSGNSGEIFEADLTTNESYQLNLSGYSSGKTLDICWNTEASVYASYIYSSSSGVLSDAYAYNAVNSENSDNNFANTAAKNGYQSCFTITTTETPLMLRLKPYYLNTVVYVVPASGQNIPKQGFLITATGQSGDARVKVMALKTNAVTPAVFDYAIYQKSTSEALSNTSQ